MFSINDFKVHVHSVDIGRMVIAMSLYESIHGDVKGMIRVKDNINFFDNFINVEMGSVEISYTYLDKLVTFPFYANGVSDQKITKFGKEYSIDLISYSTMNKQMNRICEVYNGTSNDILANLWKKSNGETIKLIMDSKCASKGKYIVPNIKAGAAMVNIVQSAYDNNNTGMFLYQRLVEGGDTRFTSLHDMQNTEFKDTNKSLFKIHNEFTDIDSLNKSGTTIGSSNSFILKNYNKNYVGKLSDGLWGKEITQIELDKTKELVLGNAEYTNVKEFKYKASEKLYDNNVINLFTSPSASNDNMITNMKYRLFNTVLEASDCVAVPNLGCGMVVDVEQGGSNLSRTKADGAYLIAHINHRYSMNDGEMNYVQDIGLVRE